MGKAYIETGPITASAFELTIPTKAEYEILKGVSRIFLISRSHSSCLKVSAPDWRTLASLRYHKRSSFGSTWEGAMRNCLSLCERGRLARGFDRCRETLGAESFRNRRIPGVSLSEFAQGLTSLMAKVSRTWASESPTNAKGSGLRRRVGPPRIKCLYLDLLFFALPSKCRKVPIGADASE